MADAQPPATTSTSSARDQQKDEVRNRLLDAWIELMVQGSGELSHDAAAQRAGVARRTAYRHFADRDAIMQAALVRVRELAGAGPHVTFPHSMHELIATIAPVYTGFDKIAPIVTMVRSTPQGRALRHAQNDERVRSYLEATAEVVQDLPLSDRRLATAMFQVLHTTPWLELRDTWGLTGEEMARAVEWAVRALLEDLKRRGALPLDRELPGTE
jgi:AcrR family transcriptional regulator